jgi:hypothetical protein
LVAGSYPNRWKTPEHSPPSNWCSQIFVLAEGGAKNLKGLKSNYGQQKSAKQFAS